jgi:hypothetical protein
MSRLFNTSAYPVVPPKQRLAVQPMTLYTPTNEQPLFSAYFIDWTQYNNAGALPNVGISLDVAQVTAGSATMSRIASVYIDNTSSNTPVYVVFPDTGFTVACGPGDTISQTVITSKTNAVVYGVGFTGGPQPLTTVYFSNQVLQPSQGADFSTFIPQYAASTSNPNIPNNTPYRGLALGDQQFTYQAPVQSSSIPTAPVAITDTTLPFNSPLGTYLYITAIALSLNGVVTRTAGTVTQTATYTFMLYSSDNQLFANSLFAVAIAAGAQSFAVNAQLYSQQNMQLKVRADAAIPIKLGQRGNTPAFFNNGAGYLDVVTLSAAITFTLRNEN